MIELKHLKTLTTLRETGSLSATANTLCLTQSALSHQIKDLELRLGCQLFFTKNSPGEIYARGPLLINFSR